MTDGPKTGIESRRHDGDLSARILAGDPYHLLVVDDPHAPMPPLTVQRAHKQRRWWTRARTELRDRGAIVGGPIRIPWGPRRGRFPWAKHELWKAVTPPWKRQGKSDPR